MAPDKLENGSQCCFNKFYCGLFIPKVSQFAFYLSLSHSVISKSLSQPFCKCCSLSLSIRPVARILQQGWPKNRRWGQIFEIQYWMYAATGGPNVKWGGTDFK